MKNTFNSKDFIGKIQKKHPADQATAIENLSKDHQLSFLRNHVNKLQPDFIAYLKEDNREEILSFIPKFKLINFTQNRFKFIYKYVNRIENGINNFL